MDESNQMIDKFLKILHDNPFDKTERLIFADWCDENGHEWAAKPLRENRIPLFMPDCIAIVELKNCAFAPATWDKKFARNLEPVNMSLTPRQYLWLWILLRKYRRSVRNQTIKEEAERRYKRYVALHETGIVKPTFKSDPLIDARDEYYHKRRHTTKVNKQVKSAEMPLFD